MTFSSTNNDRLINYIQFYVVDQAVIFVHYITLQNDRILEGILEGILGGILIWSVYRFNCSCGFGAFLKRAGMLDLVDQLLLNISIRTPCFWSVFWPKVLICPLYFSGVYYTLYEANIEIFLIPSNPSTYSTTELHLYLLCLLSYICRKVFIPYRWGIWQSFLCQIQFH